jgi:uncharacterized membrane protein HdeD (DUF308 family)
MATKDEASGIAQGPDSDTSDEARYRQRLGAFADNWRLLALRGLAALLFGLVILFWPEVVLAVLALVFGIYAAVDGAILLVPALRASEQGARKWLPLLEGTAGVVAGLLVLPWTGLTATGLLYVIVAWAFATGILKITSAMMVRGDTENRWLLAGSGALSVIFAVLLAVLADSDLSSIAPFVGVFAVVVGLALIVFAFRTRDRQRDRQE